MSNQPEDTPSADSSAEIAENAGTPSAPEKHTGETPPDGPQTTPKPRRTAAPLTLFLVRGVIAIIAVTALWLPVADYFSRPAAYLAGVVLENSVFLVKGFRLQPQNLTIDTHIRLTKQGGVDPGSGRTILHVTSISVSANPVFYCYSLPLLIALLLVGSRRKLIWKSIFGAIMLIPLQAFCMAMSTLVQIAASPDPDVVAAAAFTYWETMAIGYGYQLGNGFIPTLSAFFIWLWMDRRYVRETLLKSALRA